jgi:hypothetical protein
LVIVCWLSLSPIEIVIVEGLSAREALRDLVGSAHGLAKPLAAQPHSFLA